MKNCIAALLAVIVLAGCADRANPQGDSARLHNTEVTLEGTAFDAKGGAVLKTKKGEIIYIQGLPSWGTNAGRRISATGILRLKKYIPDPKTSKTGAVSQGAWGKQLVLEKAQWKVQEARKK